MQATESAQSASFTTSAESSLSNDSSRRWTIITQLLTLAAVVFLTALDQTVVITALLPMSQGLGMTAQDLPSLSWIISGYLLGYVIVMPLMGRVADIWGRRRLMLICLAVFAIGSLLCVEAPRLATLWDLAILQKLGIDVTHPALTWLIMARFIQAVGGGAVVPIALATCGSLFGTERRSVALGFISGVTEAGGALGPLYGAIILEKWPITWSLYPDPWMWLFLLNLPLVAILSFLLWWKWPQTSKPKLRLEPALDARRSTSKNAVPGSNGDNSKTTHTDDSHARIDWLGAVVLGAALVCLSLGLSQQAGAMIELSTEHVGEHNPYLLMSALVLLIGFILIEKKQRAPVVPLELFRSWTFSASSILSLLVGVLLIVALVNVPIFAYAVLGQSHLSAGLLLLRLTIFIPLGAFVSGLLVARLGSRSVAVLSGVVMLIGFILMSRWIPETGQWFLTVSTAVTGIGFGLALTPISATALQTVDSSRFGVAAAVSTSMRMIGMIFGLAALSSWEVKRFQQLFTQFREAPLPPGCMFECMAKRMETSLHLASAQAMAEIFIGTAVVAGVGIVIAMFLVSHRDAVSETRSHA